MVPDFSDLSDDLVMKKWSVGQGSLMGSYRHELGHHIHWNLTDELEEAWLRVTTRLGHKEFKKLASQVSTYAGENGSEMFAESFAAYMHPNYKYGMLPQSIESFMKKTTGKTVKAIKTKPPVPKPIPKPTPTVRPVEPSVPKPTPTPKLRLATVKAVPQDEIDVLVDKVLGENCLGRKLESS